MAHGLVTASLPVWPPATVEFPRPTSGLRRHDHDAVHCKACGTILNIPDEGAV